MPTSRSRSPRPDPPAAGRRRAYWPLLPAAAVVAAALVIAALPAAVVTRFLPAAVRLGELSGSVWHGVARRVTVDGHNAGAIEWRLHPLGLLLLHADLGVHWVDRGSTLRATLRIDRRSLRARSIRGGGSIDDFSAFGVAPGWHGVARWNLSNLLLVDGRLVALRGDIEVEHLANGSIAGGADLGSYRARIGETDGGIDAHALQANIEDTGGPLRLRASASIDPVTRRATLSGTLAARPGAAPAIAGEVRQLAEASGRDAAGNVPIALELTF